ncbi:MAG TPA: OsmC family protein [Kofleriaceae bacterium]|jgi:putative redox protein|nr:OsmC family protein [Kofleriaceae bacterium]
MSLDPPLTPQVQLDSGDVPYVQTIHCGKHTILADEPPILGGGDQGPQPYGLLLSALAACTSITLQWYAQSKGWTLGPVRVQLGIGRDNSGVERITRSILLTPNTPPDRQAELAQVAETTPVTMTLKRGTPITTTVATAFR